MNTYETAEEFLPENTIRTNRVFPVPPDRLWMAFSDPEALAVWWGPAGVTNTFDEFDFRPGGVWRFTMRGPDGTEYPMDHVFVNITNRTLIVFNHLDPVHGFRMSMHFNGVSAGTELKWIMVFDSAEEAAKVRPFVEPANEQNFDRLADYLLKARE